MVRADWELGSSRMSSSETPTRAFVANFSSREIQASSSNSLRRASQCSIPGATSPDLSRTFGARLFQPRPRLLRRVLGEQQAAVAACIF